MTAGVHTSVSLYASTSRRPVGTKPGDDSKWLNCDLYKVLVKPEDLASEAASGSDDTATPRNVGFGLGEKEKRILFQDLPQLSAQAIAVRIKCHTESEFKAVEEGELRKANMLAKLMDLRNANAGGFNYENRKRIIMAFSGKENSFDTGRPEVQGTLFVLHRVISSSHTRSRHSHYADTEPLCSSQKMPQGHRQSPQSSKVGASAGEDTQVSQAAESGKIRLATPTASSRTRERGRGARCKY